MVPRLPTRRLLPFVAAAAILAAATGCGSPAAPTPVMETENFSGTVEVLGSHFNTFTVIYSALASDASVTITAINALDDQAPVATTIGVAFGDVVNGACVRSQAHTATAAVIGQELVATGAFAPGPYCVQVFDAGTLTEPVTYTLTVRHF